MTAPMSGRVEVAGIVLARIRDHGPWREIEHPEIGVERVCFWCGNLSFQEHEPDCLWRDIENATDRPGDDLGLPGATT